MFKEIELANYARLLAYGLVEQHLFSMDVKAIWFIFIRANTPKIINETENNWHVFHGPGGGGVQIVRSEKPSNQSVHDLFESGPKKLKEEEGIRQEKNS